MIENRFIIGVVLATLLSGCGGLQKQVKDPHYAPSYPIVSAPPKASSGAIYRDGYGMTLFEDSKAHRVGDLLTIQLVESTNASKSASTSTAKDSSIDMPSPTLLGGSGSFIYRGNDMLNNSVDFERDFEGDGNSSQSNSLSGSITVTVAEVLPNGNLVVKGQKVVSINQGDEYIRFAGIVRPIDISPQNTLRSTQVANAHITYGGKGVIDDANQKGWLARFFDSGYMPF